MGLEKAIEHKKERRKPYKGAKAVDYSCRNHGTCEWCRGNRMHRVDREEERTRNWREELEEEERDTFNSTGIW